MTDDSTPWAMGLTVAAFVAAVIAAAIVVLTLGLMKVHPLLAVGLNLVAVGGLTPTVWEWRRRLGLALVRAGRRRRRGLRMAGCAGHDRWGIGGFS